jgi:mono/diheme cytochrome c family protein
LIGGARPTPDGPAALVFDMGQFLAWGGNTRAYYPNAQISYMGGTQVDPATFARGREVFRGTCTTCHNVDQS